MVWISNQKVLLSIFWYVKISIVISNKLIQRIECHLSNNQSNNITHYDFSLFQLVASLYLIMVAMMVGMNYSLKERTKTKRIKGEEEAERGKQVIRSSEIRFTEEGRLFSNVVEDETNDMSPTMKSVDL
jgi:hypothetical protein